MQNRNDLNLVYKKGSKNDPKNKMQ